MVQLKVVSGRQAGRVVVASRFPFVLGRSPAAHFRLEDDGVWDRHLEVTLAMPEGFVIRAGDQAPVALNDQPVRSARLRNGDVITVGSSQIRFWLAETRQATLRPREIATWVALAALCLGQVAAIYWLLR